MSIQKAQAIVLRSIKFRETSLITSFFTAEFGKIKAISKGVRAEKSMLTAQYEPFTQVEIIFYEKIKSDIHFLSECSLVYFFSKIRNDFEKIGWASYLMELTDAVLPVHEKNSKLFALLLEVLRRMEEGSPSRLVNIFELKLLQEIGFFPRLESCIRCGKEDAGGTLSLSLAEGGMICVKCRRYSEEYFPVAQGLVKMMQYLAENEPAKGLQLTASREMEEEIHRLVYRWVKFRYERDLSAFRFLREVDLIRQF